MGRYVVRRLLQMILVLFGATVILFASLFVLPGDPIGTAAGERARDPAVRAVLEKRYGLDKPLPVQYARYVGRVFRGDLGESLPAAAAGQPRSSAAGSAPPPSLPWPRSSSRSSSASPPA